MAGRAVRNNYRIAPGWRSIGVGGSERVKEHACRGRRVVRHHCVVDDAYFQSILEGDSASIPPCDVVRDDVVLNGNTVPIVRSVGAAANMVALKAPQPYAAAAGALGSIAVDQVRVDQEIRPSPIRKRRRAVNVDRGIVVAGGAVRGSTGSED